MNTTGERKRIEPNNAIVEPCYTYSTGIAHLSKRPPGPSDAPCPRHHAEAMQAQEMAAQNTIFQSLPMLTPGLLTTAQSALPLGPSVHTIGTSLSPSPSTLMLTLPLPLHALGAPTTTSRSNTRCSTLLTYSSFTLANAAAADDDGATSASVLSSAPSANRKRRWIRAPAS